MTGTVNLVRSHGEGMGPIFDSYKLKMICKEKEKTKLCVYKRKSGSGRSGNFSDQNILYYISL